MMYQANGKIRDVLFPSTKAVPVLIEVPSHRGTIKKPSTMSEYNTVKSCMDLSDQLACYATTVRKTENVKACLTLLSRLGVALDGITAKDVRDGNLKAILGLFFALSKHKQQQKQQTQQQLVERDKQQKLIGQNMNSR
ncbi:neuron navigator [Homalodisca vitripennis]|nr:neuron navigator [Homalodisca vitripennis]